MSYLRHVTACNNADPAEFRPLCLGATRVGFIRHDSARALADYPAVFTVADREIRFADAISGADRLTDAVALVSESLWRRGLIPDIRHENFAVTAVWGGETLFAIDRGAVAFFGTRSYGVHLNGIVGGAAELTLWIGRRAHNRKVAPDRLDNLVAGGMASGHDAASTLLKEAEEEAAMPRALAATAKPVGALLYRMAQDDGLRDDVLFVYDIVVPPDFLPRNNDGEIAEFYRMRAADCLRLVAETDQFKFNVNLVLIDLAIRHGVIGPDHPDYLALVRGLKGGLIQDIT